MGPVAALSPSRGRGSPVAGRPSVSASIHGALGDLDHQVACVTPGMSRRRCPEIPSSESTLRKLTSRPGRGASRPLPFSLKRRWSAPRGGLRLAVNKGKSCQAGLRRHAIPAFLVPVVLGAGAAASTSLAWWVPCLPWLSWSASPGSRCSRLIRRTRPAPMPTPLSRRCAKGTWPPSTDSCRPTGPTLPSRTTSPAKQPPAT